MVLSRWDTKCGNINVARHNCGNSKLISLVSSGVKVKSVSCLHPEDTDVNFKASSNAPAQTLLEVKVSLSLAST